MKLDKQKDVHLLETHSSFILLLEKQQCILALSKIPHLYIGLSYYLKEPFTLLVEVSQHPIESFKATFVIQFSCFSLLFRLISTFI